MSNGACQPIYMAPGMDVTAQVTQMLNAKFTGNAAAPAVPGTVPSRN